MGSHCPAASILVTEMCIGWKQERRCYRMEMLRNEGNRLHYCLLLLLRTAQLAVDTRGWRWHADTGDIAVSSPGC